MKRNRLSETENLGNEKSYEEKMHDAFMAHLGKRYEEQLLEEDSRNRDIHAPKSLDDWFLKFCKEQWGTEDFVVEKDKEVEEENLGVAEQEDEKGIEFWKKKDDNEEYVNLLIYAEQMRIKLKRQREKQQQMKKIAAFVVFFLSATIVATSTAKAFGISPWKLLIKDEGTNGIISQGKLEGEGNYYLSSDWIGHYYPAYIPEGYELMEETVDSYSRQLNFVNGTDEFCFYCVYHSDVAKFDKEQEGYELIQIEDQTGYLVVHEEQSVAYLYLDECKISICYNSMQTEEIYQIMKKIKKFS